MANKKISELPSAAALDGSESVELVQAGINVKTTTQDIADLGGGGGAGTVESVTGDGVDNTDPDNPVINLSDYAPLASPTFTGTPTLPTGTIAVTQSAADDSTKVATTAFVQDNSLAFTPADELTEVAGLSLETDITKAQLLEALAITSIIPIHADAATGVTITNMPSAATAFPLTGTFSYIRINTESVRQMRLYVRVITVSASVNNPRMYIQYSITSGASYVTLGAGTIASGDAASLFTGSALSITNWITLPSEAKGDSFIWRVVTEGGDAAADPVVGHVLIETRS